MKKGKIVACLAVVLTMSLTTCILVEGREKNKEIIITEDIREDIKAEEEEVEVLKNKATEYLSKNNFAEAKSIYEKAILMDKGNKDLYLEIKDKYLESDRLDDAYYIIKTAIDNKIDVENMKIIADNIKNRFEKIEYSHTILQGQKFELPSEGLINVNGEDIKVPIDWKGAIVDTSATGNYSYEGTNEQYGRKFKVNLEIKYKPLTEAEVRDMTLKAKNIIENIIYAGNLNSDSLIEWENGFSYATSDKYKTRQQVFDALYYYCTNDAIYSFLDDKTIEINGELYLKHGQTGISSDVSIENDSLQIEQTETEIVATYVNRDDYDNIEEFDGPFPTQTYRFIKYEGSWVLDHVYVYC